MSSKSQFTRADVDVVEDITVFDGFWELAAVKLRPRLFAGGWSSVVQRELHRRGSAAGVLLYDPILDAVGMLEQFRVGALNSADGNPWLMELVAGLVEAGESPEEVAQRESVEEAGCTLKSIEPIADYYSSPGGSDEYFYLYCGITDLSAVKELHGLEHENEDIRLHVIRYEELEALIAAGRFNNAHSLLALQWLEKHRPRLRAVDDPEYGALAGPADE